MYSFVLKLVIAREPSSCHLLLRVRTLSHAWKTLIDDENAPDNPWLVLHEQNVPGCHRCPTVSLRIIRKCCWRAEYLTSGPLYDANEIKSDYLNAQAPGRVACQLSVAEHAHAVSLIGDAYLASKNLVKFWVEGVNVTWRRRDGSVHYHGRMLPEQLEQVSTHANEYMSSLIGRQVVAARARIDIFSVRLRLGIEFDFPALVACYIQKPRRRGNKISVKPLVSKGHRLRFVACDIFETGDIVVEGLRIPNDIKRACDFLEMFVSNQLPPSKFRINE